MSKKSNRFSPEVRERAYAYGYPLLNLNKSVFVA